MNGALPQNQFQNLSHSLLSLVGGTILFKRLSPNGGLWIGNGVQNLAAGLALAPFAVGIEPVGDIVPSWRLFIALAYLVLQSTQSKTDQSTLHCSMRSLLNSPRAWSVSLGMGAEELEQQCVVGLDLCLRKVMAAMVELDETRMCNLLGNQLAQLPWNEEIQQSAASGCGYCASVLRRHKRSARRCVPPRFPAACSGTRGADQNPPARTALACGT